MVRRRESTLQKLKKNYKKEKLFETEIKCDRTANYTVILHVLGFLVPIKDSADLNIITQPRRL